MELTGGFRLGELMVEPLAGQVVGPGGALRVEPKAMEVLLELARHAPAVRTRAQIEQAVWPRGWISEDSLTRCIGQLRRALADDPRTPRVLETIPKRGYRLRIVPTPPQATVAHVGADLTCGNSIRERRAAPAQRVESLIVLPFRNLAATPDEFITEGMTELLTLRLCSLRGVRILSRTTALQFKDSRAPIAEIARRTGADWVVEGSVLQSGDRVQLVAQLIDARTDAHLWAADYTGTLQDVLALQNDMAERVAAAIRTRLGGDDSPAPAPAPPLSPATMRDYLRGRHLMSRRTVPALREAIGALQAVSAAAPGFAPAWASRAECELLLMHYGAATAAALLEPCREHLERALALEPDLGIGLSTRGALRFFFELDFDGAQHDLTRALAILPSYSLAMVQMASVAAVRHQFDDARAWIEQALLVDPVDLGVNMNRGDHMLLQRRYADAVRALQRTLELNASHRPSQLRLAWALALDGRTQAAREQLAACGATQDAAWLETAALVEAACGDCAAAARHADALDQLARSHPVTPWMRARAAAVAGRPQRALDALAEAANDRTSSWPFLRLTPAFDTLRGLPAFEALAAALPDGRH
jgi:TolB-like protein/DNA-binding winged helix-turn-helix (wHTH) protein/Tfp pilus assembly protein PilF